MNGILELAFSGFPAGYCPQDWDTLIEDAFSYTSVNFTVTGNVYYNFGATVPSVDNRVYPWYRTGTTLAFEEGWYRWDGTHWVMPHPLEAGGYDRRLFVGTLTDLLTYDGGENAAVDAHHGPFWEEDTSYQGAIPMGPGTVGSSTLAVNGTLGSATITLTADQIKHTHAFGNYAGGNDDARFLIGTTQTFTSTNSMEVHGDSGNPQETNITAGNLVTAIPVMDPTPDAVTIVPPVVGTYIIKRTARVWRAVL